MKTTRHEEIMEYIGHDPDSVADAIVNLERENERLREQVVEARREAIKWQDAWVNETPLEEVGRTLMPWEKIPIRECKPNVRDHRCSPEASATNTER
jgi:hypothetical protein